MGKKQKKKGTKAKGHSSAAPSSRDASATLIQSPDSAPAPIDALGTTNPDPALVPDANPAPDPAASAPPRDDSKPHPHPDPDVAPAPDPAASAPPRDDSQPPGGAPSAPTAVPPASDPPARPPDEPEAVSIADDAFEAYLEERARDEARNAELEERARATRSGREKRRARIRAREGASPRGGRRDQSEYRRGQSGGCRDPRRGGGVDVDGDRIGA